jgi:hypothetical protein
MKRKMKKFNEGGKTYEQEDEGLFGGKVKYREDSEGRKFVAGRANPFDRNPSEQRYYSKDDVKKGLSDVGDKISNFFGGKKEAPKSVDSEPVGDANKSSSYNTRAKSEEEPRRKIEDYIKKSDEEPYKPTGKTVLNKEADIDYKSEKKAKKAASDDRKSLGDKATRLPGNAADKDKKPTPLPGKDTKSTRMPIGYDKLDVREKKLPTNSRFKGRSENPIQSTIDSATKTLDRRTNEQKMADRVRFVAEGRKKEKADELGYGIKKGGMVKKYASGGSVKSASARADGCAIRGKTRA